jgi:hypothetical protein
MTKIYSVTVFDGSSAIAVFSATLDKARLRAHIERLRGFRTTRPAFCPKMTKAIYDARVRGQIVSPTLRNDNALLVL